MDIYFNKNNFAVHSDLQINDMFKSIKDLGCWQAIIINSQGLIIDGELRVKAFYKIGIFNIKEVGFSRKGENFIPVSINDNIDATTFSLEDKITFGDDYDFDKMSEIKDSLGFDEGDIDDNPLDFFDIEGDNDNSHIDNIPNDIDYIQNKQVSGKGIKVFSYKLDIDELDRENIINRLLLENKGVKIQNIIKKQIGLQ